MRYDEECYKKIEGFEWPTKPRRDMHETRKANLSANLMKGSVFTACDSLFHSLFRTACFSRPVNRYFTVCSSRPVILYFDMLEHDERPKLQWLGLVTPSQLHDIQRSKLRWLGRTALKGRHHNPKPAGTEARAIML